MAENKVAIIDRNVIESVANKVRKFQESGELHMPPSYSAENAMKSAWLTIQETQNMDKKFALDVCTENSIANALLDMVVQGLNPAKKQCYFIVYGQKLFCQRSYFGTVAVAKQVAGVRDVVAEVVYKDDEFAFEIVKGRKVITKHLQNLAGMDPSKIVAAYCIVEFSDGSPDKTEIMTMEQILKSWRMSKMNPIDEKGNVKSTSTHGKYPAQMAMRTVINKACVPLINASDDSGLVVKHFNSSDDELVEAIVTEEIEALANSEFVDIKAELTEVAVDKATGEILEDKEFVPVAGPNF